MAKKFSSNYTVIFVALVSVVCALLLSLAASALQGKIKTNQRLDVNKNILACFDVYGSDGLPARNAADEQAVMEFFERRVDAFVVNAAGKTIDVDVPVATIEPWDDQAQVRDGERDFDKLRLPVYVLRGDGAVEAYCIPIWGKGLWGDIYGYLAIEPDGTTVRGITFLSNHKETPGLGARIEEEAWRNQWKGKQIFSADGKLTPIRLHKGEVPPDWPAAKQDHHVDGISGATMTGKGVTSLVEDCLKLYEPFLRTIRKQQGGRHGS